MRLKAKLGDLVLEVETENEEKACAMFGYWLALANRILVVSCDEKPAAPAPPQRETHH